MILPGLHVRAWYWYAFAAEVFAACALAIFLPITLERMAREIGYEAPDYSERCSLASPKPGSMFVACKAKILGIWVDTASFSMYVKSTAVALQALFIISIGALADSKCWRKRLLVSFAGIGSLTSALFLVIPPRPRASLPVVAAVITLVGNATYAASVVCNNAFLPGLAREDPEVKRVKAELASEVTSTGSDSNLQDPDSLSSEAAALLDDPEQLSTKTHRAARYVSALSAATSRLSATGTAIGFFSGVSMLILLSVPVARGGGSTGSLMLAVGLSGLWWAVFSIPAGLGLPGGAAERMPQGWFVMAWKHVAGMVRPSEIAQLPNLFTYLLAWIFLSDGFHTTTYTAILYASSALHMSATKIVVIGILVQLFAVVSSVCAPRIQRNLGVSNLRVLLYTVLLAQLLPIYACLGLVLPYGGLRTETEMYIAAAWFGFLYGPFNSYARAVYAELIPPGHESTFFSLFSLTDKSASFLGPAIVGVISDKTGNIRYGFIFLTAMLALPVPVLSRVHMLRGREEATAWSGRKQQSDDWETMSNISEPGIE